MTPFTSTNLDLSEIDRDQVLPSPSYDADLVERLELLSTELAKIGIDYDVDGLETDPGVILQQASAYREFLAKFAIRDATLSLLLPFASGVLLELLAFNHGLTRMPLVDEPRPHAVAPEDWESDRDFRRRIQQAPEAFATAGTPGGYIFHAKSASPLVRDATAAPLNKGKMNVSVEVTILAHSETGEPSAELMRTVRAHLMRDDVKLLTDALEVRPARPVRYAIKATLLVPPGPDPALIKASAKAAVEKRADEYRRIGRGVPQSAIVAALHVPGVDSVVQVMPAADIKVLRFQYGLLTDVDLAVEVLRG